VAAALVGGDLCGEALRLVVVAGTSAGQLLVFPAAAL
jgi:hypothetical protein